ncbi:hypothetical protein Bca52824_092416 [Brassica carinata]|uniref:Uncharacterized protein n=1 Tax=Brassica carinata TaxID=52824 RepID=A0A8X7NUL6_BRACI|nr:hypothetical protein Bca52824_092416 [Brassica carinata]
MTLLLSLGVRESNESSLVFQCIQWDIYIYIYIYIYISKTGVCEVVTWNVQGTELPEECDDESIGEDKVEFVHEMLCLEDLPERESKTVKRLLGALERTKRHKLAQ